MNFGNGIAIEAKPAPRDSTGSHQPPRFKLIPFDSISVGSERVYLVKRIIPRLGLVVVWGPPKCGKSFWTFDLAMHVALGREYRGQRVQQGTVVYVALEGGKGFEARIEAFRQHFLPDDPDPVPFYLVADAINLIKEHQTLIGCIRLQTRGIPPAVIVIDTLNRSLVGSESDDKDMAAYIRAADAIGNAFACVVIVVHHCGIDATRPRGHTSLAGALDAQLAVKRDANDNIVVAVERMKDGLEGIEIVSRLQTVDVATDIDGDPISSCVVVPVEGDATSRQSTTRKLSDRQRLALDALADCPGKPLPPSLGLPADLIGVEIGQWREEMYRRRVLDRDAKNPREDFRRVRNSLQARKLIGVRDELVWRA
jgi:hypothetical protein